MLITLEVFEICLLCHGFGVHAMRIVQISKDAFNISELSVIEDAAEQ